METNSEKNNSKMIITILSVLLAGLLIFTVFNLKKSGDKIDDLTETKLKIQQDLNNKIAELDKAMINNTEMDEQLNETKNKLVVLRDSIMQLKTIDRKVINRLNIRIAELEKEQQKLMYEIDSLKVVNEQLGIEIDSAHVNIARQAATIEEKVMQNEELNQQNTNLNEKVTKGAALKISNVKASTLKERSSGKLIETDNAKRVDAFRVNFVIRENPIADAGSKKAHIVIQNATGAVVVPKGTFNDVDGESVEYSDTTDVSYENNDLEVITITNVKEGSLSKGDYYVKVYLDNKFLGTTKVTLK